MSEKVASFVKEDDMMNGMTMRTCELDLEFFIEDVELCEGGRVLSLFEIGLVLIGYLALPADLSEVPMIFLVINLLLSF